MQDVRSDIIGAIYSLLEPHPLEVYNSTPANTKSPFIFIGRIDLDTQVQNKSNFELVGTVDVEVYTGDNAWTKSLAEPYQWLNEVKLRLQPTVAFVLPLTNQSMVRWKLDTDIDFYDISVTEKHYVATITYEFEVWQPLTYPDRVITDGGVVEGYVECVLNKILN